jgi:superkiller protein 3
MFHISLCWESLGDAYMVRGAYTAALKSFQKVLELNPKALYGAIQVASIKLVSDSNSRIIVVIPLFFWYFQLFNM